MQMFESRGSEIRKPVRQTLRRAEHVKPPMSFIAMISSAILSSPEKKMTLTEINEYLMDHHECFRGEYQGWRNSVRHNLSFNKCFVKILRNPARPWAKDNHWGVIVDLLDGYLMENGKFRRRRKRQEQACRVQSITPTATRRRVSSKGTKPAKSDEPVYFPVAPPPDETVFLRPSCIRSYLMGAQQDYLGPTYNTNKPDKCSTTGLFPAAQTHRYNASALYTSHFKFNTTKSFSAGTLQLQDCSSLPSCTCINNPYNYSFNAGSSFSATQRECVSHSYDRLYKWNSTGSFPVAHQVLSNLSSNSSIIDSLPTPHHDHSSIPFINKWNTAGSLPATEKTGFLCNSPSKRIAFSIENILGNSHQLEARLQPGFYHPEQHGSSKIDVTGGKTSSYHTD